MIFHLDENLVGGWAKFQSLCYNSAMNWRKWLDECGLACRGILLATRERRFWYGFVPTWLGFAWLMNMLSTGFSKFQLLFQLPFPDNLQVAGKSFLAIFGVGQAFGDWLPIFAIAVLQGILIGLIVLLWQKKRQENSANLEKAGIITGLIALGAGCPTCGTTLIAPLVGAIFSSAGLAITGAISTVVTWLAIIIALFALKRLGLENYVIIKNEEYLAKKAAREGEKMSGKGEKTAKKGAKPPKKAKNKSDKGGK